MLAKVELEWQKRCEDMKAEHYLANELLIQDLTQARDQAKAELKEKEQQLHDLTALLRSVKTERDQAIQGLTPKVDCLASEDIHHLQEQNSILRAMVTQMRKDIESLNHLLPNAQAQPQASPTQPVQHPEAPASTSTVSIANTQTAAGGLCLEKCASTSALMKQKAHTKPTLANIMKQSALVQQLQQENVQGAKSNPSLLHIRLKQAALCIARLSRERLQLIEMGNRLRAQITTAGLQEPVESERDSSTEKQEDQHDRLSVLEQLQYQLTTQELHFALRQRACSFAEQLLSGNNNRGPATEGAANRWAQGHKITDRPDVSSSKNKVDTPLPSQSQSSQNMDPQPHSGLSRSWLSSEESLQSLKELWEILDHRLSPSVFSEGELSRREMEESGAGAQLMVHGMSAPFHSQPPPEVQPRRNPPTAPSSIKKTSRLGTPGRISKIRNYNVKD